MDWDRDSVKARPGYFGITLNTTVETEMSVTNHSALYKFTFPDIPVFPPDTAPDNKDAPLNPVISMSLSDLTQPRSGNLSVDPGTGRMTANGTFEPSFGKGEYILHFCADFQGAGVRDAGYWMDAGNKSSSSVKVIKNHGLETRGKDDLDMPSNGTFVRFHRPQDNTLLARVGVSFMGVEQACQTAEREQPDFDFKGTVSAAEDAWREKLSVVEIDAGGVSKDMEVSFWSGMYRAMLSPQDYTGENPLWESDEPYYDNFYW